MQLVRNLCSGQLTGDQVGSQFVTFIPGMLQGGNLISDTGTAGLVIKYSYYLIIIESNFLVN